MMDWYQLFRSNQARIRIILLIGFALSLHGLAQAQQSSGLKLKGRAVIVSDIGGRLHGIAFDNQGHMFVAKDGKQIFKVAPDGSFASFAVIAKATGYYSDGPGDTFIYDLEFGSDGHLYVAAEDRVLKINSRGEAKTLYEQAFTGRWGACGIALDKDNTVFLAYDNQIIKIHPDGRKSTFIDGSRSVPKLECVVGMAFDAGYQTLFVCDGHRGATGKLISVPIQNDGTAGTPKVVFKRPPFRPEYVGVGPAGLLAVKGPENHNFVLITPGGTAREIDIENNENMEIATIAFGKAGFQSKAIYGSAWVDGKIYRIDLMR